MQEFADDAAFRCPGPFDVAARAGLVAAFGGRLRIHRTHELAQLREGFEVDARIAHRLLSQQVVQHDAILFTLALLQPAADLSASARPEQRLTALYPQIIGVVRRDAGQPWPDAALTAAEQASRTVRRPVLVDQDFAADRYRVLFAAEPVSYALVIHARNMVPWSEWPMPQATSRVRVWLDNAGQQLVLQPGMVGAGGWRFEFHKHLAAASQPFDMVALRQVGWTELPWAAMLLWCVVAALALAGQYALQRQRTARRRAEELLRLGQVGRLNTLGELAAGMAHELNQPLTALLANTQAAQRLLADDPPEIDTARNAMTQAVAQARRASDVVGRLRRTVERPDLVARLERVELQSAARRVLDLLEPECARRDVVARVDSSAVAWVQADPVALEQIVHNLFMNALQALEKVAPDERQLVIGVAAGQTQGVLRVADSGPGIAPEVLPRIFEPFFSTRSGGLGLGLSLCESLAAGMGGSLSAAANTPRGAVFTLALPLAATEVMS